MAGPYTNIRKGIREDLGIYVHSGWEADFARYLNLLQAAGHIDGWAYEPMEFSFQGLGYKRGPFTYKPDFAVYFGSNVPDHVKQLFPSAKEHAAVFFEVKGQEKGKDRSKWRRFRKHTDYELEIVKRDKMIILQRLYKKLIPEWESNIY